MTAPPCGWWPFRWSGGGYPDHSPRPHPQAGHAEATPDMTMNPVLSLNLRKSFPDFELSVNADLPGGIAAVFGPSGSGKTTLLNCIAGLERPDDGEIQLRGQVLYSRAGRINLAPERRRVGYMFQEKSAFPPSERGREHPLRLQSDAGVPAHGRPGAAGGTAGVAAAHEAPDGGPFHRRTTEGRAGARSGFLAQSAPPRRTPRRTARQASGAASFAI